MKKFYKSVNDLVKEYIPDLPRNKNELVNYPQFKDRLIKLVLNELLQMESSTRYNKYKIIRLDIEDLI